MANRFFSPSEQFANSAGVPYAGGSLQFYASGTATPLNTYSDQALTIPNANPVPLDSAGRAGNVFLSNLAYKVVLSDASSNQIYTADPVYASDFSTPAQFQVISGSPNGVLAGTAGAGSTPSSAVWDSTNNILYICTTTGNAGAAVWTAVNAASAAAVVPQPQGYLTPTSGVPIILSDSISATSLVYTPYVGNIVPIYNGASFTPTTFAELSLTLVASHAANTIYDVFAFNNSGVVTLCTGPAWTTSTAGAGARGAGAGTTQLQRINGLWVNAVLMSGRNGSTTFSNIGANLATYLGSISIDAGAGQVTQHRAWGSSRKWGIWNAYNRVPVILKAGDSTVSWTYSTSTWRASRAQATNSLSIFSGLAEDMYELRFTQSTSTVITNQTTQAGIGIGFNSTTVPSGSGLAGSFGNSSGAVSALAGAWMPLSQFIAVPSLGINTITALEDGGTVQGTATFFGQESGMQLTAAWRA